MPKESALELADLVKVLDRKEVLKSVSFRVEKGEVFGFLGPNGAGKTTTMKCVLGLIEPDGGTVRILGEEGLSLEGKRRIGFMPENTYLYKYLTGREFLRFNGNFFGMPKEALDARVEELLEKVGLAAAGDRLLSKYSKGMLQRIGLAQAIVNDPEIVFLDEPMSGLDPLGRKMVKDLILELKDRGATVVFNTHILSDVESICDHFAIIHQGRIVADERTKKLKEPLETYFIRTLEKEGMEDHEVR
jgi:ABC-2 type transport system ATP-binding protein